MSSILQKLINLALEEDIGSGDITSEALCGKSEVGSRKESGVFLAKQDLIVSGLEVARRTLWTVDDKIQWKALARDGQRVVSGTKMVEVAGELSSLLQAERTALNFLQHLSGIATFTNMFVKKIEGYPAQILDTRKTLPGFRSLEKKAVLDGGGKNHRLGLYDRYLIKDNHLAGMSITQALSLVREHNKQAFVVELEVQSLAQIEEALSGGADILLLDNFSSEDLKKAVAQIAGRAKSEASGGINLSNIVDYAKTGVDFISIGALTHSAPAADISLEIGEMTENG